MFLNIIILSAVAFTADSLFCAKLKTLGIYSEKFFEIGDFVYDKDGIAFVKNRRVLIYTAPDTIMVEYSTDMAKMDTLFMHYPFLREGVGKVTLSKDHICIHSGSAMIRIHRKDKSYQVYPNGSFYSGSYLKKNGMLFSLHECPSSTDMEHIWLQQVFITDGENLTAAPGDTLIFPSVAGFPIMLLNPRSNVALFDNYIAMADPCIQTMYYYDYTGKLLRTFRLDSLLSIKGICEKFASFKLNKRSPKNNFDELLDMNDEGGIIRSMDNYKGRLMIRIALSYHDCDIYIIDPETLKWEKFGYEKNNGNFSQEQAPIDNFTVIDGDYFINMYPSDLRGIDFSKFKDYKDFRSHTDSNRNNGTSYLVREMFFE